MLETVTMRIGPVKIGTLELLAAAGLLLAVLAFLSWRTGTPAEGDLAGYEAVVAAREIRYIGKSGGTRTLRLTLEGLDGSLSHRRGMPGFDRVDAEVKKGDRIRVLLDGRKESNDRRIYGLERGGDPLVEVDAMLAWDRRDRDAALVVAIALGGCGAFLLGLSVWLQVRDS
jgi:hypothetical protein